MRTDGEARDGRLQEAGPLGRRAGRRAARLHRRGRSRVGRAPPALGHPRQPGARRGAASEARIITPTAHLRMQRLLRSALRSAEAGRLAIGAEHEDVHSAVEFWLTRRDRRDRRDGCTPAARATTRWPCDVRLYLKDRVLSLHARATALAEALLGVRRDQSRPHCGPATPTSGGRCRHRPGSGPAAYAEGLLDTIEADRAALWPRLDRSPLGSAAGYGVPLPLDRRGGRAGARVPRTSTTTWPRCRTRAGSSRRRCSSGAPSWATRWRSCRRT